MPCRGTVRVLGEALRFNVMPRATGNVSSLISKRNDLRANMKFTCSCFVALAEAWERLHTRDVPSRREEDNVLLDHDNLTWITSALPLRHGYDMEANNIVGTAGVVEVTDADAAGAKVVILRISHGKTAYDMMAKPSIKSLKDLKGKKICLGGIRDITRVYFERLMQASGIKDGQYRAGV